MKREPWHSWWLFLLCAFAEAGLAILFFFQNPDGSQLNFKPMIIGFGVLAIAAGVLTIVAAIWYRGIIDKFFLSVNGLMYCAIGTLFFIGIYRSVSFADITGIIFMMPVFLSLYFSGTAQLLRGHIQYMLQIIASSILIGFYIVPITIKYHWIHLDPSKPKQSFYLLASYFLFSALCKYFPIYRLWLQKNQAQKNTMETAQSA